MKVPAGTRAKIEPQQIHCKKTTGTKDWKLSRLFPLTAFNCELG